MAWGRQKLFTGRGQSVLRGEPPESLRLWRRIFTWLAKWRERLCHSALIAMEVEKSNAEAGAFLRPANAAMERGK